MAVQITDKQTPLSDVPGTAPPLCQLKEVIPVGVGMRDAQLLVLNSAGQLAGVGEQAELYVRSPHIAKGKTLLEYANIDTDMIGGMQATLAWKT